VEDESTSSTLALHPRREGEDYFLGIFLVGAYQEILGDLHNLFGDTDSINVELTEDGGYRLVEPERGDTVDELLRYVHFEPDTLRRAYRDKIYAIGLRGAEAGALLAELEHGLTGYTYLEE
jgi:arginine decarboxylase